MANMNSLALVVVVQLLALVCLPKVVDVAAETSIEKEESWREGSQEMRVRSTLSVNMTTGVSNKIIGGNKASPGQFPFYVQGAGCGGSLIGKDMVLTAAHCYDAFQDWALVGAYSYADTSYGAQLTGVKRRVRHPSYNSETQVNDFMIVQLSTTTSKTPVKLNNRKTNPYGGAQSLTVIGMGSTAKADHSDYLMKATLKNVPATTCAQKYPPGWINTDSMMCAAAYEKDSCSGDSGGPILDSKKRQVGVVSFGIGCANAAYPGVYSRVSFAYSWIKQQICKYSRSPPSSCRRRKYRRQRKNRHLQQEKHEATAIAPTNSRPEHYLRTNAAAPMDTNAAIGRSSAAASTLGGNGDPTCADSNETFDLFDNQGDNKDCAWLAKNMFWDDGENPRQDLCEFAYIAFRCPRTCGDCSILTEA